MRSDLALPDCGDDIHNTPRCGHPDAYTLAGRWDKTYITYWLGRLYPMKKMKRWQQFREIRAALDVWETVTPLRFAAKIRKEGDTATDLYMAFVAREHGDGAPFDGPGATLAHAFIPSDQWDHYLEGDIHFDKDEDWVNWLDLRTVAIHEIGHAIGLGHSAVRGATMYPYYGGKAWELHEDDIAAIRAIYGT